MGKANYGQIREDIGGGNVLLQWRGKYPPPMEEESTPVFLPGESQGWRSLVGCRLWGRTESDTTEAT